MAESQNYEMEQKDEAAWRSAPHVPTNSGSVKDNSGSVNANVTVNPASVGSVNNNKRSAPFKPTNSG